MAVIAPTISRYDNHIVYRWVLTGVSDGTNIIDTMVPVDTTPYGIVSWYMTGISKINGDTVVGTPNVVILAYPDGASMGGAVAANHYGTNANLTAAVTSAHITNATPFMGCVLQNVPNTLNGGVLVIIYMVGKTRAAL
jgi:hypothetical protein